jgi:hypothetical protein
MAQDCDLDPKDKRQDSEKSAKPSGQEKKKADPKEDEALIEERLRSLGYL